MKHIANIVTKSKKYKFNEFFNVVSDFDKIDVSIPTIVVGMELSKACFGGKLNHIILYFNYSY